MAMLVGKAQDETRARAWAGAPQHAGRITLAGAAGGVGLSTVTLALAGLLAWSGRRVAVLGGDTLLRLASRDPWRGPDADDLARLPDAEVRAEFGRVARSVAAVPGLWLLRWHHGAVPDGLPVELVLLDQGRDGAAADLMVARPDQSLEGLAQRSSAPVVLNGQGPCSWAQASRMPGMRLAGRLPWDARVARAAWQARVPHGLPGSYLAALRTLLPGPVR